MVLHSASQLAPSEWGALSVVGVGRSQEVSSYFSPPNSALPIQDHFRFEIALHTLYVKFVAMYVFALHEKTGIITE